MQGHILLSVVKAENSGRERLCPKQSAVEVQHLSIVCFWACPAWGSPSREGEVMWLFCKHVTTFHLFTTYAALPLVFIYFCPMWNSCHLLRCWQCSLKAAGFQSLPLRSKAAATSLVCICVGAIRIFVGSVTCASGTQMLLSDGSRTPLHAP